MRLAIRLAKRAEGMTSPNPLVGAVIVRRGKVVGSGYHRKAGLPHAEVNALGRAGRDARGATLYVTLEPCDHFGRTPPCTDAIIKSGIKRVVAAMKDPNPVNNGKGIKKLRRHGIEVTVGLMEEESRLMNRPYLKFITEKMPYVTIKIAETLDGKIATRTGDSRWITSDSARRYVHRLRGSADAVMVGAGTVVRDDPLLTARIPGSRQPVRVVVDSRLRVPLNSKIFSGMKRSPVIIATTKKGKAAKRFEGAGARLIFTRIKAGRVDIRDLLERLAGMGITSLMVEGGGELVAGFLEEGLADRVLFFIAPRIIGGRDAVTPVEGMGAARVADAIEVEEVRMKRFGRDILVEGTIRRCSRG